MIDELARCCSYPAGRQQGPYHLQIMHTDSFWTFLSFQHFLIFQTHLKMDAADFLLISHCTLLCNADAKTCVLKLIKYITLKDLIFQGIRPFT